MPLTIMITKPAPDARVGMQMQPLDDGTTVVDNVAEGGLAHEAGIMPGDKVISINGVAVTDYEQGAALVIAAASIVNLTLMRPADALSSGETLESLLPPGVDLATLLQQQQLQAHSAVEARAGDAEEEEEAAPAVLVDADGNNAHTIQCRFCGGAILPRGKAAFVPDLTAALPPMPRPRDAPAAPADEVAGCWRAGDKYDFDNLGVSKSADERGLRYLVCAGCDMGPFGWFADERQGDTVGEKVDFFVAVSRVRYDTKA
jgi:hypothetical protein